MKDVTASLVMTMGRHGSRLLHTASLSTHPQMRDITLVVIGAKNIDQLKDNLQAGEAWTLSEAQITLLDDKSAVAVPCRFPVTTRAGERAVVHKMGLEGEKRLLHLTHYTLC